MSVTHLDLTVRINRSMGSVYYITSIISWLKQDPQEPRQHLRWLFLRSLCSASSPHLSYLPVFFLPFVIYQCSSTLRCDIHFTGLPFEWLVKNPQRSNILVNLSQVWTVTRKMKFMRHNLDWLPASCSGASLTGWSSTREKCWCVMVHSS